MNADSQSRDVVRRAPDPRSKTTPNEAAKPDPPLHWPTITPLAAEREWPELRRLVDELRRQRVLVEESLRNGAGCSLSPF